MRRWIIALALMGAAGGAAPGGARAEPLGGRLGVGADTSLSLSRAPDTSGGRARGGGAFAQTFGVPGLSGTFFLSDLLGFEAIAAMQVDSGDIGGTQMSVLTLGLGGRVLLAFEISEGAHLSAFAGVSFALVDESSDGPDQAVWRLGAEIGVRPEWFISEHFSLHTQVGVALTTWHWVRPATAMGDSPDWSGWNVDVAASFNLLGNAGFTWWF